MDISSIAGVASQMSQSQAREGISLMAMKMAAEEGRQIAGMIEAASTTQKPDPTYNISLYA